MYLEVVPSGSKIWRMRCRQPNGKNTRLTFGPYPEVSLLLVRRTRMDVKALKSIGDDLARVKRIERVICETAKGSTFEALARESHANRSETWKENTAKDALNRPQSDVFPIIGHSLTPTSMRPLWLTY